MQAKDNVPMKHVRGEIELFSVRGDQEEVLLQKKNVVLNGGADLLALALGGQKWVNGMYFGYDNFSPPLADVTPDPTRTASFYQDIGAGETQGLIRVPTISTPAIESTDGIYNGNKVTFTAITAGSPAVSGAFNDLLDNVSDFYGAGLAYLDPDDVLANDILFSAVTFADLGGQTHFTKLDGAQIGLRWSIIFEAP